MYYDAAHFNFVEQIQNDFIDMLKLTDLLPARCRHRLYLPRLRRCLADYDASGNLNTPTTSVRYCYLNVVCYIFIHFYIKEDQCKCYDVAVTLLMGYITDLL